MNKPENLKKKKKQIKQKLTQNCAQQILTVQRQTHD